MSKSKNLNGREDIRVSIGLPVYNAGKYLDFCLKSILNQTYQNWELIVINDGSTDNSLPIIQKLSDSRIRVVDDGKNIGLSARLNQSIDLSSGELYCRMDADDIMHPDRLAIQVNLLKSSTYDVIGTNAYVIDSENRIIGQRKGNDFLDKSIVGIFKHGGFIHPSIMGRIDWFRENPYDILANRCEDIELWIRTIEKSSFYNYEIPLLFYREDLGQWIKTLKTHQGYLEMIERKIHHSSGIRKEIYKLELKKSKRKHMLRSILHHGGLNRIMELRRTAPISKELSEGANISLLKAISKPQEIS